MSEARRALTPPAEPVVVVSRAHVSEALAASRTSPRRRVILPFHKSAQDPLHRMLNAMQPGTYVQPHRHQFPPQAEVFLVLEGAIDLIVFDDLGHITHALALRAGSEQFGGDLAPGLFHTFVVRAPDTVIYEIKLGPYAPTTAKDFASWAPSEGAPDVAAYVAELERNLASFRALSGPSP